ncbi:hypothetical protein BDF20DRAFT_903799 [Mycotypha africana]|uniref:uncharacterized protein n=1 Tax=Mycotypha africana TaxID=64632 RepID=UPI002300457F|nr:uncharacterized protein BDF20DRAFT_903799 [Mycotypha africana]KAI8990770.1 hypothetical protein BDF20DRAFT_903799 [Mycotypha africana]
MSTSFRLPYGYRNAPPWPSLYWPFEPNFDPLNLVADIPHSLYYLNGIWAFIMLEKSRTFKWYISIFIPLLFVLGGSIASFVIGSIMGVALAFVYNAGFFVMSTWIPFLWALIHILVVLIGSYSTITAVL